MRFRFSVGELREEMDAWMPLELEGDFDRIELGRSDLVFIDKVKFKGHAVNSGSRIIVSGTARGKAMAVCDRCLEDFPTALDVPISETYHRVDEAPAVEDEDDRLYGVNDVIDLTEALQQGFILHIPITLLCSEGCRGLCPKCGKNLNEGACECAPEDDWGMAHLLRNLEHDHTK